MTQEQRIKRFAADLSRKRRNMSKLATRPAADPGAAMVAELERMSKFEGKPAGDDRTAQERFIEALRQH